MFDQFTHTPFIIAVFAAIIFCAYAWYKKWLTAAGAITAAIPGILILTAGSWRLALPMLLFFISGSLFGKLKSNAVIADAKSKKPRDHIQVLCNGGIAGVCALLFLFTKNQIFITTYFLSIAISTADTWSSELGLYFDGNVIDIVTLKRLDKGLSGGISFIGTMSGLTGAFFIGILYFLITPGWKLPLLITIMGFAGMLLDSVIGSTMQAVYRLTNGKKAETPLQGKAVILEKGWPWMTNDLVNLLSNVSMTLLGGLLTNM